jgi:MFS transporter, ACS family, D-galactonate transporter
MNMEKIQEESSIGNLQDNRMVASKKVPNIRWIISALLFFGITIQSIDRATLGAAMPMMSKELSLSPDLIGIVLASFFWSYTASNIPGGILVDRFKPRKMFTFVAIWWSFTSVLTGLSKGFVSLLSSRVLLGAGQGADFAAAARATRVWFPKKERATASAIYSVGNDGGTIIGLPLAALIMSHFGWREVFYAGALISIVWGLIWWWYYEEPRKHRWLSTEELDYIEDTNNQVAGDAQPNQVTNKKSWVELFKHRQIWGITLGYFCNPYSFFTTWLPMYLTAVHHLTLVQMGLYGMLPGITGVIGGFLGGIVSDKFLKKTGNISRARKIPIFISFVFGSFCFIAVGFMQSVQAAVLMLSLTSFSLRLAWGSIWSLPVEVAPSPNYVGSITGIMNTAGNLGTGCIMPILIGVIVATTGSFISAFVFIGIVGIISALAFAFLTGPVQPIWKEN